MHTEPSLPLYEEHALALRRRAMADVWRGADTVWARVQQGAAARLARSTQRLQARLRRRGGQSAIGARC